MKKLISGLAITIAAISFSVASKAADTNSVKNNEITQAFNRYFAGASNVEWYTSSDNNYVADFTMMGAKIKAFFDANGNLLITSRSVAANQLPLALLQKLQKKYAGQQIRYVTEYSKDEVNTYIITLESNLQWTMLKANAAGQLEVVQQLNKA